MNESSTFVGLAYKYGPMKNYYVNYNSQENGDNEVHVEGCTYMPEVKKYVGLHKTCKEAVENSKIFFANSVGCKHCCAECHKK